MKTHGLSVFICGHNVFSRFLFCGKNLQPYFRRCVKKEMEHQGGALRLMPVRVLLPAMLAASLFAQEQPAPSAILDGSPAGMEAKPAAAVNAEPAEHPGGNRVFGVLPNYRTADASQEGTVLTARQKLDIAAKDSFDYPLVALAGAFAGLGQWTGQQPSFGQGAKGFGHRLVTNYADQSMGNMFTEGVFPVLLHEDPRYFRRGTGTIMSRAGYALSRVLVTHKDSGGRRFNYSEWLGNASAAAVSNAYYPDSRTALENGTKLLTMVGTDAVSQVLKEFWPDIRRKLFHKGRQ
jgi:hypothetical protein